MKLTYKFAIAIVSVTMLSIIILGAIFTIYADAIIKERISDQLISVSTLKENQLNMYIEDNEQDIEALVHNPELIGYMTRFHGSPDSNEENSDMLLNANNISQTISESISRSDTDLSNLTSLSNASSSTFSNISSNASNISNYYDKITLEDMLSKNLINELNLSKFNSLSVLTVEGVVALSTMPGDKGKILSNEPYFINGLNSTYAQQFYISTSTREPALTIATPILDSDGTVVGVLVGDVRLDEINNIMVERSGLGDTGETILINKNHLLISESRFIKNIAFKEMIYAEGANQCLNGSVGIKEYADYRNVPIIGYFKWMPKRDACLVTKIDIKEAFNPLNILYIRLLIFGIAALILSLSMAYILSRIFTKPISALVKGTEQWSKGNLDHKVPVTSDDEIAVLCKAFNDASQDMLRSRELEKNYTKDLKKELDQKTHDMMKSLEELEQSKKASLNIMDDLFEGNKHLMDLDKAKTDFLNVASHELKTPLTAISAYLEILDDYKGQFNAEQLQGLDAIKRNSNQLKMLIGNILEISRLDSGRFDLNITEINVKEKIALLVDNLKILSDNKHLELKYDCDSVEKISTDAMRFEEILNNLIGNAIKFTETGLITIKTEFGKDKEIGFVVISVIDTGVGIPEEKMSNLFQKFYQVDATVSRKHGGTGLGLSITKKMIELQGGKISVSSVVGKGTTFRFTLPIQQAKKEVVKNDSVGSISDVLYPADVLSLNKTSDIVSDKTSEIISDKIVVGVKKGKVAKKIEK